MAAIAQGASPAKCHYRAPLAPPPGIAWLYHRHRLTLFSAPRFGLRRLGLMGLMLGRRSGLVAVAIDLRETGQQALRTSAASTANGRKLRQLLAEAEAQKTPRAIQYDH